MPENKTKHPVEPLVKDIYDVSDEFLTQLKTNLEQSDLKVPTSNLVTSVEVPAIPTVQDLVDALAAIIPGFTQAS
jgi:hypothetical protein